MAPELREALADDLLALIRLHDRELDAATLAALQAADFPGCLALLPEDEDGKTAYAGLGAALADLAASPPDNARRIMDELAADYAAIYLNNRIGASPYESVWLDDDHLTCQRSMFELREIYQAAGLSVSPDEQRYDDHLVLQLHYLRHQLRRADADLAALAGFIDEHLGFWLPDFVRRVARFADTDVYTGAALVTAAWLSRLREILADVAEALIPERQAMADKIKRKLALDKAEVAPIKFMPGAQGPSW